MARLPRGEYLAAYQRFDLTLDPFPYNGGVTTGDSLWMGMTTDRSGGIGTGKPRDYSSRPSVPSQRFGAQVAGAAPGSPGARSEHIGDM